MFNLGATKSDLLRFCDDCEACERGFDYYELAKNPDDQKIKSIATKLINDRGDDYEFALRFVLGFYKEYCKRNNLELSISEHDCDYLLCHFLQHFITLYIRDVIKGNEVSLLDFVIDSMRGTRCPKESREKFKFYFWEFYNLFECDIQIIYLDCHDVTSNPDDYNASF